MKWFSPVGAALIVFITTGCEQKQPSVLVESHVSASYDFKTVVSRGNFSYIPVNKWIDFQQNPNHNDCITTTDLLGLLAAFENENSHLEIVQWEIMRGGTDGMTCHYVNGILIRHRQRQPKTETKERKFF